MKIGLLITARMKSSRLPFKLLKELNGLSIIEHVIFRSKKVSCIDDIVLCTSTNFQDKALVDVSINNNIYYYLGSEEDVLQRLFDCAKFFSFDYIISITGENPLFSIDHANLVVDKIKRERDDFILVEGLPIGCAVYGINVNALATVCKVKKEIDTEIWGPLFNRPDIFNIGKIPVDPFYNRPNLRLTNDYQEDFKMMEKIFSHFKFKEYPTLSNVLGYLDDNPNVLEINSNRKQLALDEAVAKRIDEFYTINKDKILKIKKDIYNNDLR